MQTRQLIIEKLLQDSKLCLLQMMMEGRRCWCTCGDCKDHFWIRDHPDSDFIINIVHCHQLVQLVSTYYEFHKSLAWTAIFLTEPPRHFDIRSSWTAGIFHHTYDGNFTQLKLLFLKSTTIFCLQWKMAKSQLWLCSTLTFLLRLIPWPYYSIK